MAVEWIHDPRAFLARDWTALVEADPEGTVFHTPRYLKVFWEEFGAEHLHLAIVEQGGRELAGAAFDIRDQVLTWLGGFNVTDYMGPAGAAEAREPAAKELMNALASRDDWRRADLAGLPGSGGWLRALRLAAQETGLAAEVAEDNVAPLLQLPASYEHYLQGLTGKLRHELRRKDRRLREAFPDVRLVDAGPATMTADLARFMEMHRSSAGGKGRFMVPGMELFFRRLAETMLPDGTIRLAFLEAGGRKLAGAIGFRFRDRFLLYNSAYDQAHAAVAPGMVLVAELIRGAIEEGCRAFDFLKGDLPYKYRFGARPRQVCRLLITER
jgi:CelD/BcsL family acetyltransferase involved in cellulose biosynthesis